MICSNEDKLYEEFKGFLVADRPDLRIAATDAVLQLRDRESMEQCIKQGLVPLLAKNVSYGTETVAVNALKALVHLSSHGTSANQCVEDLLEAKGLNRMLEIVLSRQEGDHWKERVNYAMALLANLTRTEAGAVDLVGRSLPEQAVKSSPLASVSEDGTVTAAPAPIEKLPTKPTLELLLAKFMNPVYQEDTDYESLEEEALDSHAGDPYQHFAAVLMNSTQTEAGRRFLVKIHRKNDDEEGRTVLQTVLSQLKAINPIRRRGIAGTIRNCCLDRDSAWWYLNVVKLPKHILYPLAGPEALDVDEKQGLDPDLWLEGPDKKREPDHMTRIFLVESILLLLSNRASRPKLRLDRTYVILKFADMVEEHEDVSERILDCVNFLRRDEEGTAEGSSDKFVEDAYQKPSAARQVGATANDDDDFDDVD